MKLQVSMKLQVQSMKLHAGFYDDHDLDKWNPMDVHFCQSDVHHVGEESRHNISESTNIFLFPVTNMR
jgi:hypothetical protein